MIKLIGGGVFGHNVPLGHQQDPTAVLHGVVQRQQTLFPSHIEVGQRSFKHHNAPHGQYREQFLAGLDCFTHTIIPFLADTAVSIPRQITTYYTRILHTMQPNPPGKSRLQRQKTGGGNPFPFQFGKLPGKHPYHRTIFVPTCNGLVNGGGVCRGREGAGNGSIDKMNLKQ